ncbi:hypothetical protein FOXG_00528 [Fusarium oxysporum f. sp. lycopersici 4287]|uniref:Uncharacterized protein n=3 Tax=Fusarium oxysporum TaxID=5507 RepID=A0A0J9U6F6_FUSO4|nr:hypothetical protein FOXG_00528 [Fusarium oxysporum f. sp. lycopersici 4287]EXK48161.1 hypothetical protein FOMG_01236 [Fusarium oxysporum f. sp. melonis 26406]KNA94514.1 hypothetical protein FOXG_00528 [Fusarium oxysporum f. sp. lycopersici 4287]
MRVEQCEDFHGRKFKSRSGVSEGVSRSDADSVRDETTKTGVFLRSRKPRNQPRTAQRGVDIVDALPKTCKRVGARVGTWTEHAGAAIFISINWGGPVKG